jgi:DNA repair photolyase
MSNVPKQKTGRCRVMQVLRYQPVHRYDTNPCTQQAERIALLRAAKARGLMTWASLEPVIDPEQTLSIIRTTAAERIIDHYAVGKLNHHQHASTINWRAFAREVRDLLETLGVSYRLKDDLQQYLS